MKKLFYCTLVIGCCMQFGCESKQKELTSETIIGVWQNTTNQSVSVEFTESFEYNVIVNGEKILNKDSVADMYSFSPNLKEKNLKIFNSSRNDTTKCNLIIINPKKIKLSILHADTVVSEAEFIKIKY